MIKLETQITEQEIRNLKNKLNRGIYDRDDTRTILPHDITPEQTYKGLAWLIKQASLRASPFGEQEQSIIADFAKFELIDFVNTATEPEQISLGIRWYQPVYRVYSNNGNHFDYYYDWQQVKIVG